MKKIVVTYEAGEQEREMFRNQFPALETAFLAERRNGNKPETILDGAEVLISWNPTKELKSVDPASLRNVKFVQLLSAGYDHLKFEMFPSASLIAANQGAYALPMAEHVLAMILAGAKKLRRYHDSLAEGKFNQLKSFTRQVTNATLGIIGFGSIGKETARLMGPFNVNVIALNTSGKTDREVGFCGTLKDLDHLLVNSDFVVISIPLTDDTEGLIGKRELEEMKEDAVLINVARGPVIKERDLYEHLKTHPDFFAGIDAWWVEPFKFGKFEINYPFFELPNLLGSPHNSALVDGIMLEGAKRAAENVAKYISGEKFAGVITRK